MQWISSLLTLIGFGVNVYKSTKSVTDTTIEVLDKTVEILDSLGLENSKENRCKCATKIVDIANKEYKNKISVSDINKAL